MFSGVFSVNKTDFKLFTKLKTDGFQFYLHKLLISSRLENPGSFEQFCLAFFENDLLLFEAFGLGIMKVKQTNRQ